MPFTVWINGQPHEAYSFGDDTPHVDPVTGQTYYTPDVSEYAGGDPVMAMIAVGHDPEQTNAAQAELEADRLAKGSELTDVEVQAVLAKYPSADTSLATLPLAKAGRDVAAGVSSFFTGLVKVLKWVAIGGGVLIILIGYSKVRRAFSGIERVPLGRRLIRGYGGLKGRR